jgi:hypothetical protein
MSDIFIADLCLRMLDVCLTYADKYGQGARFCAVPQRMRDILSEIKELTYELV